MNVTLPPELERLVQRKVEHGGYATAEEVVHDALHQFLEPELRAEGALREKIAAVAAEREHEPSTPFSAEEIMRKGREILAARQSNG